MSAMISLSEIEIFTLLLALRVGRFAPEVSVEGSALMAVMMDRLEGLLDEMEEG